MKRVADGGRRGSSETSLSTFSKRPRKASGSRSLPLTRSLRIVDSLSVPSIYHALLETKQLPKREPATFPIRTWPGSSDASRFPDRIFGYPVLALVDSLNDHFDLGAAVLWYGHLVNVVRNTGCA